MELELGLAPPNPHLVPGGGGEFGGLLDGASAGAACGKRAFGRAEKATLPLFVRDGDGGGGGGARDGVDREASNKRRRLVGWPPVKCAHRRSCGGGGGYVKVRMEGVAIGRKVDVSLHGSYEELLRTLVRMFPSTTNNGAGADAEGEAAATQDGERRRRGHHTYVVTYEDGEGDWLLVGDVPWEDFARSVKRLKILS